MKFVRIVNPTRTNYVGKVGTVIKEGTREGRPYLGVEFEGVAHVVWFYEDETEAIVGASAPELMASVLAARLA